MLERSFTNLRINGDGGESNRGCLVLQQVQGGFGASMTPIFKRLRAETRPRWEAEEQGWLRSVICAMQWPQCRLAKSGLGKVAVLELQALRRLWDSSPCHTGT